MANDSKMTFGQRIKLIRENLNLKRPEFSELIGVSLDTVQRVENKEHDKTNDYIFSQTVKALPIVEPYLSGNDDVLPDNLVQYIPTEKTSVDKDGDKLRAFMKYRLITQKELAQKLALTQPQINHYLKTKNLRSDIKTEIATSLNVHESEIWSVNNNSLIKPNCLTTKAIKSEERNQLTHSKLISMLGYFDENLTNSFAIEIARYDKMEPLLPLGSVAIAVLLKPEDYGNVSNCLVFLSNNSAVVVGRIASNLLKTSGTLHIYPYDGYKEILTVKRSEIKFMAVLKKAIIAL